jgi:hypothetical protein
VPCSAMVAAPTRFLPWRVARPHVALHRWGAASQAKDAAQRSGVRRVKQKTQHNAGTSAVAELDAPGLRGVDAERGRWAGIIDTRAVAGLEVAEAAAVTSCRIAPLLSGDSDAVC